LIKIVDQLCKPYQSVLTGVKFVNEDADNQDIDNQPNQGSQVVIKKRVDEASLADQIETNGYHLRKPITNFDFSKKSKNTSILLPPRQDKANNE
jgi:hypothetical protein